MRYDVTSLDLRLRLTYKSRAELREGCILVQSFSDVNLSRRTARHYYWRIVKLGPNHALFISHHLDPKPESIILMFSLFTPFSPSIPFPYFISLPSSVSRHIRVSSSVYSIPIDFSICLRQPKA